MVLVIGAAAFAATYLGGSFALRFKDKLHLITGFSAGAIIGVAFFDLLPEALTLRSAHHTYSTISVLIAAGFVLYMGLERVAILHSHHEAECENARHRGLLGASSLSFHSLLDGVIIGFAFKISQPTGIIVSTAILTHDFSDGINTVTIILRHSGGQSQARRWLLIDALAPVIGIGTTFFFSIPKDTLAIVLSIFCGCFIYIGASDLLPESHHAHPKTLTTLMTLLGMSVLYVVIQVVK